MQNTIQHGGKREGSGRKSITGETGVRNQRVGVVVTAEMLDWIKSKPGTTSEVIRQVITEAMKRDLESGNIEG